MSRTSGEHQPRLAHHSKSSTYGEPSYRFNTVYAFQECRLDKPISTLIDGLPQHSAAPYCRKKVLYACILPVTFFRCGEDVVTMSTTYSSIRTMLLVNTILITAYVSDRDGEGTRRQLRRFVQVRSLIVDMNGRLNPHIL